jgi:hypothetical protein
VAGFALVGPDILEPGSGRPGEHQSRGTQKEHSHHQFFEHGSSSLSGCDRWFKSSFLPSFCPPLAMRAELSFYQ